MDDALTVSGETCAKAWLAASRAVLDAGGEAYNVLIRVADPTGHDAADHAVIGTVDGFLRGHGRHPVVTVANTIFPEAYARRRGAKDLYDDYGRIYRRMKRMTRDWGRYFDRMIRWRDSEGEINQLDEMIQSMRRQLAAGRVYGKRCFVALGVGS